MSERSERLQQLLERVRVLETAIRDHRDTITAAGLVRVDARDAAAVDAKQRADVRLWDTLP